MKDKLEKISETLPDIIKNSTSWFLKNLDENTKDIVDNSTGTVGILLKIFGKPIIDKIYENRSKNKLENFGAETYLEAAQKQVSESILLIEKEINLKYTSSQIIEIFSEISTEIKPNLKPENLLVIFNPQYHPTIEFVKENQKKLFEKLELETSSIDIFIKDFNKNINKQVELTFGDDYKTHLDEIQHFIIDETESKLLLDTIKCGRIGFDLSEDLQYEETFAEFLPVSELNMTEERSSNRNSEKDLKPIVNLINDYFEDGKENIEKILFIVADFGKGKSVFMKHYAADLAKKYIKSGEGFFPIYFNLREYSEYKSDEKLGVISKYLSKKYGFEIESNKNRKYLFLIDSLDESGELTQHNIDEVINSIEKIQDIDRQHCRDNRIIITSRPINDGLVNHLCRHNAHIIKNKENRNIPHYISIYGFKKDQFNNWLNNTLLMSKQLPENSDNPLIKRVLFGIKNYQKVDIYRELSNDKTLSSSELQRPIFAYMIYQLIIKNIDFLKVGQIGIYLSFINLLSKDAKYINDKNLNIDLKREFEFRNLLSTTAALWQFERHRNNQGFIKKSDICRVLDGENKGDSDKDILDRYKDVSDVQFLSHSYFGENNNTLHFQHQSFAEILLAEYYLKVFICHAFDVSPDTYKCREKLLLGEPTIQTKFFLRDLLKLLKETVSDSPTKEIIEKRKLLFPLLASLATQKNNTLFCKELYYKWYDIVTINEFEVNYPNHLLVNWYFNQKNIDRIIQLSADILNSNDSYILTRTESRINLFDKEVNLIRNSSIGKLTNYIDKGFALMVGNNLCNNISNKEHPILFNTEYKIDCNVLAEFLNSNDRYSWDFQDLFLGIDTRNNELGPIEISSCLFDINLSFSYFKNTYFVSTLGEINFNYCVFEKVEFYSELYNIELKKSKIKNSNFYGILSNVDFFDCSQLENIGFRAIYNTVIIDGLNQLNRKYINSLSKRNKIIIPQQLDYFRKKSLNNKIRSYGKSKSFKEVRELNQIINFVRVFGKTYLNKMKGNPNEIKEIFIFANIFVEKIFYTALLENIDVDNALKINHN